MLSSTLRPRLRSRAILGWVVPLVLLAAFARSAPAQTIYAVDNPRDRLIEVDRNTGAAAEVGPLGVTVSGAGLMTKPDGTLWALLSDSGTTTGIYSINVVTGAATLEVQLDRYLGGFGAEFDPTGQDLYIVNGSNLFRADPATGATTLITSALSPGFVGLTVTPGGTFYAFQSSVLYSIDVTDGTTTAIGTPTGPASQNANCAFDPSSNEIYSIAGGNLIRTDLALLQATSVGSLGLTAGAGGIAVLPAAVPTRPVSWSRLKSAFGGGSRPPASP